MITATAQRMDECFTIIITLPPQCLLHFQMSCADDAHGVRGDVKSDMFIDCQDRRIHLNQMSSRSKTNTDEFCTVTVNQHRPYCLPRVAYCILHIAHRDRDAIRTRVRVSCLLTDSPFQIMLLPLESSLLYQYVVAAAAATATADTLHSLCYVTAYHPKPKQRPPRSFFVLHYRAACISICRHVIQVMEGR